MEQTLNVICFETSTVTWLFSKVKKKFQNQQGFEIISDYISNRLKSTYIGIIRKNLSSRKNNQAKLFATVFRNFMNSK